MKHYKDFSRDELLKLVDVYAKNWLAHDGCWFLSAEKKYGMETAIGLDKMSWYKFAAAEAARIKKVFDIPDNGGLKALEQAFQYRLYAAINKQETEWTGKNHLIFKMTECRVQKIRSYKKLPLFPCKEVGLVEFSRFAETIDSRIKIKCISCPPDPVKDFYCGWEYSIK